MHARVEIVVLIVALGALVACGSGGGGGGGGTDAAVDGGDAGAAGDAADASPADAPPSDGGMNDGGGEPDAPPAGIAACEAFEYHATFQLAPAPASAHYRRCETRGPETGVRAAVSPDGAHVAVITTSGTVRLFATGPWREVAQLAAPQGVVDAVAFSPDGATLATLAAEMGLVTLWNAADGARGASVAGPPASTIDTQASALAYSSDGRHLASSLGTVITLADGASASVFTGGTVRQLAFTGGDRHLFVDLAYRIGNSPPSRRIFVVELASGTETELFDMYDRALTGVALSADGARAALSKTDEAEIGGAGPGLSVHRTDTGAAIASDPAITDVVLGFSRDGARLFTFADGTVNVRDAIDLHVLHSFAWPMQPDELLAVSPADELVTERTGTTTWWETSTGTARQTLARPLDQVAWTADGRYGVGADAPDARAMFVFWREADATLLCAPPPIDGEAPALDELGTVTDASGNAVSEDGTIEVRSVFVRHTHATDYYASEVVDTDSGEVLRRFGAEPRHRAMALSDPAADQLFTIADADVPGAAVQVWCR